MSLRHHPKNVSKFYPYFNLETFPLPLNRQQDRSFSLKTGHPLLHCFLGSQDFPNPKAVVPLPQAAESSQTRTKIKGLEKIADRGRGPEVGSARRAGTSMYSSSSRTRCLLLATPVSPAARFLGVADAEGTNREPAGAPGVPIAIPEPLGRRRHRTDSQPMEKQDFCNKAGAPDDVIGAPDLKGVVVFGPHPRCSCLSRRRSLGGAVGRLFDATFPLLEVPFFSLKKPKTTEKPLQMLQSLF